MIKKRVIARLDIKNEFVIKGIQLEGLRKIGSPIELASKYYTEGIDEIIFIDAVASLYERNNLFSIIEQASRQIFIPITIGGGIRTLEDVKKALMSGADKVAINTAAIRNPKFITEISRKYGAQCIVGYIEAKKRGNEWEAYINSGREATGKNVKDWIIELQDLGVGEILLTSVDRDGTKKGFDLELLKTIENYVKVPLIVAGGFGDLNHFNELNKQINYDAVAIATAFHYNLISIQQSKLKINNLN